MNTVESRNRPGKYIANDSTAVRQTNTAADVQATLTAVLSCHIAALRPSTFSTLPYTVEIAGIGAFICANESGEETWDPTTLLLQCGTDARALKGHAENNITACMGRDAAQIPLQAAVGVSTVNKPWSAKRFAATWATEAIGRHRRDRGSPIRKSETLIEVMAGVLNHDRHNRDARSSSRTRIDELSQASTASPWNSSDRAGDREYDRSSPFSVFRVYCYRSWCWASHVCSGRERHAQTRNPTISTQGGACSSDGHYGALRSLHATTTFSSACGSQSGSELQDLHLHMGRMLVESDGQVSRVPRPCSHYVPSSTVQQTIPWS